MKKTKILTIIAIFALLKFSCTDSTSGGETLNEKIALYMPDGITPAVDASVKFFSIGDTSAIPAHQILTDAEGRYSVSGVTSTGYYNVIAEYEDSLFTMQDTVYISHGSHMVKDDTLNNPGSISGVVALQPNHSHLLNNVYVIALGMGRAVNVDSTGWFTMTKLAPGDYNLQFDTDIENYGSRFVDITISSSFNDTITDTITLPYNSIPIITGISSSYDTLNGIATICWNKTSYGNISNYLIFRKSVDSIFFPESPIGWVSANDTTFNDTIFNKSIVDSQTYYYDYTIAILDSGTVPGPTHGYTKVSAISPLNVTTFFYTYALNQGTGLITDSSSINDSVMLITSINNPARNIEKISWAIGHIDSIKKDIFINLYDSLYADTFSYLWNEIGDQIVFTIAVDNGGTIWIDTTIIHIIPDYPNALITTTTPIVSINDTIIFYGTANDIFGSIIKWEWDIGNSGNFVETSPINSIVAFASPTANNKYPIILKVTDDDENVAFDTINIIILADTPIPSAYTPSQNITVSDTIQLRGIATDTYGSIIKWEWKFGDNPWTITSSGDTTIKAPSIAEQTYICSLRVTDNDNEIGTTALKIPIMGTMTDIDGNTYHTVKIGNQIWTVENLYVTRYNDGAQIPMIEDSTKWANDTLGAYCYYNNSYESKKYKFGALYNRAAIESGKIQPIGWHIPTKDEWEELTTYLITNGYNWDNSFIDNKIAKAMSSRSDWNPNNKEGTPGFEMLTNNSSGFSAMPAGVRFSHIGFKHIQSYAGWWSISTNDEGRGISGELVDLKSGYGTAYGNTGLSIRLIKNK